SRGSVAELFGVLVKRFLLRFCIEISQLVTLNRFAYITLHQTIAVVAELDHLGRIVVPFPRHRLATLAALADFAARDDEDIAVLLWGAGLLALAGRLAPEGLGAPEAATLAALAAAVRMVDRVHGG